MLRALGRRNPNTGIIISVSLECLQANHLSYGVISLSGDCRSSWIKYRQQNTIFQSWEPIRMSCLHSGPKIGVTGEDAHPQCPLRLCSITYSGQFWLFLCQIDASYLREGKSIEKMPLSYHDAGRPLEHFFKCCCVRTHSMVCDVTPRQVVLDSI